MPRFTGAACAAAGRPRERQADGERRPGTPARLRRMRVGHERPPLWASSPCDVPWSPPTAGASCCERSWWQSFGSPANSGGVPWLCGPALRRGCLSREDSALVSSLHRQRTRPHEPAAAPLDEPHDSDYHGSRLSGRDVRMLQGFRGGTSGSATGAQARIADRTYGRDMGRLTTFLLLLTSLVGCLFLPAARGARASARTERLALQAADAYWLHRGLSACAQPRIEYAALAQRASGDAYIGPNLPAAYCVIRVSTRFSWRGRAGAVDFCWTIVHERGHQAGLLTAAPGSCAKTAAIGHPRSARGCSATAAASTRSRPGPRAHLAVAGLIGRLRGEGWVHGDLHTRGGEIGND